MTVLLKEAHQPVENTGFNRTLFLKKIFYPFFLPDRYTFEQADTVYNIKQNGEVILVKGQTEDGPLIGNSRCDYQFQQTCGSGESI